MQNYAQELMSYCSTSISISMDTYTLTDCIILLILNEVTNYVHMLLNTV